MTHTELKQELYYEPLTGDFIRLKDKGSGRLPLSIAGRQHPDGYIDIGLMYKSYKAHRLAWFYMTGKWPINQIDHKNRVRNDNRWVNLREVTSKENNRNRTSITTTKCTGVNFIKSKNKYRAAIKIDGKSIYLGFFNNIEDAIKARKAGELKYW